MAADTLRFEVVDAATLTPARRAQVFALFAAGYREADAAYLAASVERLRRVVLALDGDTLAGFGLAAVRVLDLPGLPRTLVRMAGIACVAPSHRRRHVMVQLMSHGLMHDAPGQRSLVTGRMAHPATFRMMAALPHAVPRLGVPPSPWQQAIGAAVAAAYGAHDFDPQTFVCRGRGAPIGYPVVEIEATPEEWALFAPVDRSRGDSLLGFAWLGDPPTGW